MEERIKTTAKKLLSSKENSAHHKQNTGFRSQNSHVDQILFLQRTIGNQAVQNLIRSGALQAKLSIGQTGDKYEQEADRVAELVMRLPKPEEEEEEILQTKPLVDQITPLVQVQRQEEPGEEEEMLQAKPLAEEITPFVQMQVEPEEEEEEELQAKVTSDRISEVNSNLESQIQSLKGSGQPLSENDRAFFEPSFGVDFSHVRIHTTSSAVHLARSVNALAFTLGHDVVFGAGEYTPSTSNGKKLIAHELAHVVQQGATSKLQVKLSGAIQRQEEVPAPAKATASALTQFTGSNFIGDTVVADLEFVDSLEAIDEHAGKNNVQVYVTDSFRSAGQTVQGAIVAPATRSNHLAGHAIDMNVQSGGRLYNSEDLNNFESLPEDVQNFINDIRNDPGLRWGGDFQKTDPVHIDDNLNSNDAEWQERYKATQASQNP